MIDRAAAEKLVADHIQAWNAAWTTMEQRSHETDDGAGLDFAAWKGIIDTLDRSYFAEGASSGSDSSFGTPAEHDPAIEKVIGFVVDGETAARVETEADAHSTAYFEYEVVAAPDGAPRLKKIRRFFEPKGTRLVDPDRLEEMLSEPRLDAELEAPPRGIDPDGDAVFEDGREITVGDNTHRVEVRALGSFTTKTGILAPLDFGYDAGGLEPFARKIAPGSYPVDGEAFKRAQIARPNGDVQRSDRVSCRAEGSNLRFDFRTELTAPLAIEVTLATGFKNGVRHPPLGADGGIAP